MIRPLDCRMNPESADEWADLQGRSAGGGDAEGLDEVNVLAAQFAQRADGDLLAQLLGQDVLGHAVEGQLQIQEIKLRKRKHFGTLYIFAFGSMTIKRSVRAQIHLAVSAIYC
jgi:hypothetical protein